MTIRFVILFCVVKPRVPLFCYHAAILSVTYSVISRMQHHPSLLFLEGSALILLRFHHKSLSFSEGTAIAMNLSFGSALVLNLSVFSWRHCSSTESFINLLVSAVRNPSLIFRRHCNGTESHTSEATAVALNLIHLLCW